MARRASVILILISALLSGCVTRYVSDPTLVVRMGTLPIATGSSGGTAIAGYCAEEERIHTLRFQSLVDDPLHEPYGVEASWVLEDDSVGSLVVERPHPSVTYMRIDPRKQGSTQVTVTYRDSVTVFRIEVVPCFGIQIGYPHSKWMSGYDFGTGRPVDSSSNADLYLEQGRLVAPYGAEHLAYSSDPQYLNRSASSLPLLDKTTVHPSGTWAVRTRHGSVVLLQFRSLSQGSGYGTWGWYRKLT